MIKCIVELKELKSALKAVMNAISRKSYLPILQSVLIETSGKSSLILSTTDLEISIRSQITAEITQKGIACIPAKRFFEIVKVLPKSVSQIELEQINTLDFSISAAGVTYQISGMAADEFPKLPTVDRTKIEVIPADIFCDMVQKVGYAVSNDECRHPALNGVLWQTSDKKSIMVATDGHQLVKAESKKIRFINPHTDVIIPLQPLTILNKLVTKEITEIGVIFGDNNLTFVCGDTTISTRLIEETYPNYKKVIPKNNDQIVIVEKEPLLQALQQLRVSIVDDQNYRIALLITESQFKLSTKSASMELPCQFEGQKIEVAFSINYLINIVEHIEGNKVKLVFAKKNPLGALVVTSINKNDGHLCLIMPLRKAR